MLQSDRHRDPERRPEPGEPHAAQRDDRGPPALRFRRVSVVHGSQDRVRAHYQHRAHDIGAVEGRRGSLPGIEQRHQAAGAPGLGAALRGRPQHNEGDEEGGEGRGVAQTAPQRPPVPERRGKAERRQRQSGGQREGLSAGARKADREQQSERQRRRIVDRCIPPQDTGEHEEPDKCEKGRDRQRRAGPRRVRQDGGIPKVASGGQAQGVQDTLRRREAAPVERVADAPRIDGDHVQAIVDRLRTALDTVLAARSGGAWARRGPWQRRGGPP